MKQLSKKLMTLVVGLTLLLNACGKKEEKTEETQSAPAPAPTASTPATPIAPPAPPAPPPPALPAKFEDVSPGTPVEKAPATQKTSFDLMAKNLKAIKSAKVVSESKYDYIVTNFQSETPTFAKGPNNYPAGSTFQFTGYDLFSGGYGNGLTIERYGDFPYVDPDCSYQFKSKIVLGGLTLYSTESVALFLGSSDALEILKVNYTTATPVIQRFRITQVYHVRADNKGGTSSKWIIFQQNYETSVEKRKKN